MRFLAEIGSGKSTPHFSNTVIATPAYKATLFLVKLLLSFLLLPLFTLYLIQSIYHKLFPLFFLSFKQNPFMFITPISDSIEQYHLPVWLIFASPPHLQQIAGPIRLSSLMIAIIVSSHNIHVRCDTQRYTTYDCL